MQTSPWARCVPSVIMDSILTFVGSAKDMLLNVEHTCKLWRKYSLHGIGWSTLNIRDFDTHSNIMFNNIGTVTMLMLNVLTKRRLSKLQHLHLPHCLVHFANLYTIIDFCGKSLHTLECTLRLGFETEYEFPKMSCLENLNLEIHHSIGTMREVRLPEAICLSLKKCQLSGGSLTEPVTGRFRTVAAMSQLVYLSIEGDVCICGPPVVTTTELKLSESRTTRRSSFTIWSPGSILASGESGPYWDSPIAAPDSLVSTYVASTTRIPLMTPASGVSSASCNDESEVWWPNLRILHLSRNMCPFASDDVSVTLQNSPHMKALSLQINELNDSYLKHIQEYMKLGLEELWIAEHLPYVPNFRIIGHDIKQLDLSLLSCSPSNTTFRSITIRNDRRTLLLNDRSLAKLPNLKYLDVSQYTASTTFATMSIEEMNAMFPDTLRVINRQFFFSLLPKNVNLPNTTASERTTNPSTTRPKTTYINSISSRFIILHDADHDVGYQFNQSVLFVVKEEQLNKWTSDECHFVCDNCLREYSWLPSAKDDWFARSFSHCSLKCRLSAPTSSRKHAGSQPRIIVSKRGDLF